MTDEYALFPLPLVAFPHCRLPLQIFEPRYLDLVKSSLSEERAFGIVTTVPPAGDAVPGQAEINPVGTLVRIVDFNEQPNGLLGIVCEGQQKFTALETYTAPSQLMIASVELAEPEPLLAVPDELAELVHVLQSLLEHPYVVNLGYQSLGESQWLEDASRLSFYLSYLLPFPNPQRYQLLTHSDAFERLATIQALLDNMDGSA